MTENNLKTAWKPVWKTPHFPSFFASPGPRPRPGLPQAQAQGLRRRMDNLNKRPKNTFGKIKKINDLLSFLCFYLGIPIGEVTWQSVHESNGMGLDQILDQCDPNGMWPEQILVEHSFVPDIDKLIEKAIFWQFFCKNAFWLDNCLKI